jgi:hypothetical protein
MIAGMPSRRFLQVLPLIWRTRDGVYDAVAVANQNHLLHVRHVGTLPWQTIVDLDVAGLVVPRSTEDALGATVHLARRLHQHLQQVTARDAARDVHIPPGMTKLVTWLGQNGFEVVHADLDLDACSGPRTRPAVVIQVPPDLLVIEAARLTNLLVVRGHVPYPVSGQPYEVTVDARFDACTPMATITVTNLSDQDAQRMLDEEAETTAEIRREHDASADLGLSPARD